MELIAPFILNSDRTIPHNSIPGSFIEVSKLLREIQNAEEKCFLKVCETAIKLRPKRSLRAYNCNIEGWYLSNAGFKENFRMLPSTIEELILILGNDLSTGIKGRPSVDVKRQILLAIWVLSNQESFRGISQRFGVDRGHSYVIFRRFVNAICEIRHRFIKRAAGINRGKIGFETLRNRALPGAVAAIDGCQIPIKAPKNDKSSYFNRKQYYSVNLQAVCDHQKSFIDVFVGWPGSSHDSRVFRKSSLYAFLESGGIDPENHIIGDSGYPLRNYLIVPYKDNGSLTAEQKNFNKVLSSNRCIIEQAFGLLVVRFRRLKYLDMSKMELIPKVIVAACILHNICLYYNDLLEETPDCFPGFDNHRCSDNSSEEAKAKRDRIANMLLIQ